MKLLDIALKDMTRSFRSLFAIGMMVAAPLLITGLIYLAFGGFRGGSSDLPAVKVAVANLDRLPENSPLQSALGQAIYAMLHDESVKSWLTAADYPDEAAARAAVDRKEAGVAVIIPAGFTAGFLDQAKVIPITILQDPTLGVGPQVVQNMVSALLDGVAGGGISVKTVTQRLEAAGLSTDPAGMLAVVEKYQAWYTQFQRDLFHNPEQAALKVVAPSAGGQQADAVEQVLGKIMAGMMSFFAFFTGANAMQSLLKEEEEGTLQRLFTTPTSRTTVLAGKFLAVFLTVILQGLVMILAATLLFNINWGQPASVALALVGQVAAASGLGVLIIAFCRTTQQAGTMIGGVLTALGMAGGVMTVAVNMPPVMDVISLFTPHGWVMRGWKMALNSQVPLDLLLPAAVSVLIGVAMFAAGARLFRRRYV